MRRPILAIDPGPKESAYVVWDGVRIRAFGKFANEEIFDIFKQTRWQGVDLYIEMIASYGMAVGAEVFETCVWIGRFDQAFYDWCHKRATMIKRMEVKLHLCGSSRAKDANVRQALIDLLGAPGTKKSQGVTYGISGDVWAALGVAVTAWNKGECS